jgi:hypothetical protein
MVSLSGGDPFPPVEDHLFSATRSPLVSLRAAGVNLYSCAAVNPSLEIGVFLGSFPGAGIAIVFLDSHAKCLVQVTALAGGAENNLKFS